MATSKSLSKSGTKSKLSALKSLVMNVAKGTAKSKAAAAPAPKAPAKPGQVKAASPTKAAAPAKAAAPKDKAKATSSVGSAAAPAKGGKRVQRGAPATSLGVGVFAGAVAQPIPGGDAICREVACESLQTSGGYCRLHYIKNWKKIQRKAIILREKKLNQYIEELVAKYPDKYIEAIRQDLADDKAFAKVIYDLDLDEGVDEFEGDSESVEAVIDGIKRDFEDGDEGF